MIKSEETGLGSVKKLPYDNKKHQIVIKNLETRLRSPKIRNSR